MNFWRSGARSGKFNAKITEVDGIKFRSKREAKRYQTLKMLLLAGAIHDLSLQPRFPFIVNGTLICTYVADFLYKDAKGQEVVEEVKGFQTPEYKIKAKLFKVLYPQYIYLVTK